MGTIEKERQITVVPETTPAPAPDREIYVEPMPDTPAPEPEHVPDVEPVEEPEKVPA